MHPEVHLGISPMAEHLPDQAALKAAALKDASGIAKTMLDNNVNGADLLLYREPEDLQADLRMTPFAARKALQVRDLYLDLHLYL